MWFFNNSLAAPPKHVGLATLLAYAEVGILAAVQVKEFDNARNVI